MEMIDFDRIAKVCYDFYDKNFLTKSKPNDSEWTNMSAILITIGKILYQIYYTINVFYYKNFACIQIFFSDYLKKNTRIQSVFFSYFLMRILFVEFFFPIFYLS